MIIIDGEIITIERLEHEGWKLVCYKNWEEKGLHICDKNNEILFTITWEQYRTLRRSLLRRTEYKKNEGDKKRDDKK